MDVQICYYKIVYEADLRDKFPHKIHSCFVAINLIYREHQPKSTCIQKTIEICCIFCCCRLLWVNYVMRPNECRICKPCHGKKNDVRNSWLTKNCSLFSLLPWNIYPEHAEARKDIWLWGLYRNIFPADGYWLVYFLLSASTLQRWFGYLADGLSVSLHSSDFYSSHPIHQIEGKRDREKVRASVFIWLTLSLLLLLLLVVLFLFMFVVVVF